MAGWHHRLSGHGFGWTLGVGDGQGGLAGCSSWGREESDMTERLNGTELKVLNWGLISGFREPSKKKKTRLLGILELSSPNLNVCTSYRYIHLNRKGPWLCGRDWVYFHRLLMTNC